MRSAFWFSASLCLVSCLVHGKCMSKKKVYKGSEYRYYVCKDCFRFSSRLLDRIIKDKEVDKVIIKVGEKEEYLYRIDIKYKNLY